MISHKHCKQKEYVRQYKHKMIVCSYSLYDKKYANPRHSRIKIKKKKNKKRINVIKFMSY